jgi:hypothetical protein
MVGAKKACGQKTAKRPSVLDKKVVDRATALQRNESRRCAVESRYEFRLRRGCTGGVAVKRRVYCIGDEGYVVDNTIYDDSVNSRSDLRIAQDDYWIRVSD